jgi:tetratricopeptide (TPR) repeat protein
MRRWLKNVAVLIRGVGRIGIFLLTERTLPAIGMYSAAEYIVIHYYGSLCWEPDQHDLALAAIYEKARKIDRAEERLRQAIAIRSDEPDNYMLLGQFFARQKRPSDAIRTFEQAISVAPDNARAVDSARRWIEELHHAT